MQTPSSEQIVAGRVVRDAIRLGMSLCRKPITGVQLDKEIEQFIRDNDCVPVLRGYQPPFSSRTYQHTICLSLNNQAVHGVPTEAEINPAEDLITIDLVVGHKGWHADSARTFIHGVNKEKELLLSKLKMLHINTLNVISPNSSINLYSQVCSKIANDIFKIGIVKEFCGHGIGLSIHEDPQIPCVPSNSVAKFEIGRSYAIEPVVAAKMNYKLQEGNDGWVVSANCLTAHMEDTIFVTAKGIVSLTSYDN